MVSAEMNVPCCGSRVSSKLSPVSDSNPQEHHGITVKSIKLGGGRIDILLCFSIDWTALTYGGCEHTERGIKVLLAYGVLCKSRYIHTLLQFHNGLDNVPSRLGQQH